MIIYQIKIQAREKREGLVENQIIVLRHKI
jgi:hypothetical protein